MKHYKYSLTSNMLSHQEQVQLNEHLFSLGLDDSIWSVYESFLHLKTRYSVPLVLRVQSGNELVAAVFLIKCYDHGSTLSSFYPLAHLIKYFHLPAYVWMRSGIGAEILANPGFINLKYDTEQVVGSIIKYMNAHFFMVFTLDFKGNSALFGKAVELPYPDEGVIDLREAGGADGYRTLHRNLKKKIRTYRNKGGTVDVVRGQLDDQTRILIGQCVEMTAQKSTFKLPYQENYSRMCMASAAIDNEKVIHFICKSRDHFFGYHSFIQFEKQMRCLNGAFNRGLPSTYHAYENMILKVIEHADSEGIEKVYFGPVLNETKRRMMHGFIPNRIYFTSNNWFIRNLFPVILKNSRMMNKSMKNFISQ